MVCGIDELVLVVPKLQVKNEYNFKEREYDCGDNVQRSSSMHSGQVNMHNDLSF